METINDIVREIATEMLNTSMQDITAERIHGWATRLGATCKESLRVGNAAKMREVVYGIKNTANSALTALSIGNDMPSFLWDIIRKCEAALSAPARNCDLYTKDEVRLAYHLHGDGLMTMQAFSDWLFAEAKGEAK